MIPDPATKAKAQTQLDQAKSRYANSRYQAQQAIDSLDNGIGGMSRALSTVAQAERTQTQAAVVLARQAVAALTIKAPISGILQLGGPAGSSGSGICPGR